MRLKKWSIYYLKKNGSQKIDNFILKEYLDEKENLNKFSSNNIEKNLFRFPLSKEFKDKQKISGYIYIYKQRKEEIYWLSDINSILDNENVLTPDSTHSFKTLILLNINNKMYAISYSYGYTLLNPEYIVSDFGLKIAKNELNVSKFKRIRNTIIKNTPINTTANSTYSLPIRELFSNNNLNIINEVMGGFNIDFPLTNGEIKELNVVIWGERSVEIKGNFSINEDLIPLIKKLSLLYKKKDKEKVLLKNELKPISTHDEKKLIKERLIPYFKGKYLIYLNNSNEINNEHIDNLEINLPLSRFNFDETFPLIQYRINGVFQTKEYIDYLDSDKSWIISNLFRFISNKIDLDTEDFEWDNFYKGILIKTKINYRYVNEEGETKEGRLSSLYNSIYFECTYNDKKYVLLHGKWYFLEKNIWKLVRDIVNSISDETKGIDFNMFTEEDRNLNGKRSEGEYNKRISNLPTNSNIFCLDKKNFTSSSLKVKKFSDYDLNPDSSIEPCDLLKIDEEDIYTFCHIKTGSLSAQLSHLLSQTRASCELIKSSPKFIEHINKTLEEIKEDKELETTPQIYPDKLKEVNIILGCIVDKKKTKQLNSKAFPILFNLNLASLYEDLKDRGFNVSLVKIEDNNLS